MEGMMTERRKKQRSFQILVRRIRNAGVTIRFSTGRSASMPQRLSPDYKISQ